MQHCVKSSVSFFFFFILFFFFFFFYFFFFFFFGGGGGGGVGGVFTALSRIFHLYRADRSSNVGENRSTRGKPPDHP